VCLLSWRLQAGLLPVHKLKPGDPMFGSALDRPEPLVTFALSCGSASSPPVSPTHTFKPKGRKKENLALTSGFGTLPTLSPCSPSPSPEGAGPPLL